MFMENIFLTTKAKAGIFGVKMPVTIKNYQNSNEELK
jgi:hypothetical protein